MKYQIDNMTDEVLTQLINDKFEALGSSSCKGKESFIFMMKAIYGETFDIERATDLYEELYITRFGGDCNGR